MTDVALLDRVPPFRDPDFTSLRVIELLTLILPAIGLSFVKPSVGGGPVLIFVFALGTGLLFGGLYRVHERGYQWPALAVALGWLGILLVATGQQLHALELAFGGVSEVHESRIILGWTLVAVLAIQPRHRPAPGGEK